MNLNTQASCTEMDNWWKNVNIIAEESVSDEVRKILCSIKNFNDPEQNKEKLYLIAANLANLSGLKLETNNDLKVIDLITDLMRISSTQNVLICIKFAKINFKIFHNNIEYTKSTEFLDNFISTLCELIIEYFECEHVDNESRKMTKIQLSIIIELQNMFSPADFKGNKYIIGLFIRLINVDISDLEEQFTKILNKQLENSEFYQNIFSIEDQVIYSHFLRYCMLIIQIINENNLLENVTLTCAEKNFICMLINSLGNHLDILETDSEAYEIVIQRLISLMFKLNGENLNFEIIEKHLIKGVIGNDYGLSVICFNIFNEFLVSIESIPAVKSYFKLLQELLLLIWNPLLEFSEQRQFYIFVLLKTLYKLHQTDLKSIIDGRILNMLKDSGCNSEDNENSCMLESLARLQNQPTAKNYYKLIENIHSINNEDEKSSKEVSKLIQLVSISNWNIFHSIVRKIIDLITMTKNHERKMLYLLKFDPLSGVDKFGVEIPLEIAQKLLEMLLSFMSKTNGFNGLRNYIKKSLDVLLDLDVSVRRTYLNLRMSKTPIIKEEETLNHNINDILKELPLININHECKREERQIVNKFMSQTNQFKNLDKMLLYSKWLLKQQLKKDELIMVNEIILNLQKVCTNERNCP